MKKIVIVIAIIVIALLGGGGIIYYFDYQNNLYIKTDDAQISADMITITPQLTGRIENWTAKVGDVVTNGQTLGTQETKTQLAISGAALPAEQQAALTAQLASKADVTSPIDGKIIEVLAVKGQLASASTPLAVVADTGHAYITAYIKETEIADLKLGQKVDIRFDAYSGIVFAGTVDTVGQAAQSVFSLLPSSNSGASFTKVTQIIPVKITIDDAQGYNLIPGINASVKIYKDAA